MQVSASMIEELTAVIVHEVNPEYIYLFGSQVTGDTDTNSDVDLLVVEKEGFDKEKTRWQEMQRIRKALRKFRIAKDILVYSHREFDALKSSSQHVVSHAVQNGRLLYARH